MAECIFCRIAKGLSPCEKVYEDESVIGFLDIEPISSGHTLVLPKKHYPTLLEISEEDLAACMAASPKIAKALLGATGASGFNLLQNNHRTAGQLVDHVHFHLIPRFAGDNLRLWRGKHFLPEALAEMGAKIRARL